MNKPMTLHVRPVNITFFADTVKKMNAQINRPLQRLGQYYGRVLDRRIDRRQTISLLEAQTAFFLGITPAAFPLLLRVALLVWAVAAVCRCRRLLRQ
ncbi:MAG: hypothetical protein J6W49_05795 [Paludibacteraceae bacterium]|nr:hypothetical protein [Paludibacteraceae bacterium]